MNVLCFDIASGGISAAIFNEELAVSDVVEVPWQISNGADGSAVLPVSVFNQTLKDVFHRRPARKADVDAISFAGFMHSVVLLGVDDLPLTPIFTWMDRRGDDRLKRIRGELGSSFHQRTGCRYHPMFPIFKIASLDLHGIHRVASAKSLAIASLTGNWVEDHGTASASGLYNLGLGTWDEDLVRRAGLDTGAMLPLVERAAIAGRATNAAASSIGILSGTPVVAGSGDGLLASAGSGCEESSSLAATLGTSASVRKFTQVPILDEKAGTFCYSTGADAFLLGCASSNGGNVLDWARSVFGGLPTQASNRTDLPTFIPLLHGERSPEWNPSLSASWHGVVASHTSKDLAYAAAESVVFNLAHYLEIIERVSGEPTAQVVLSGNGFLDRLTAVTLAAILDAQVLRPPDPGLASLRGAALCGLRALGVDAGAAMSRLVAMSEVVGRVEPLAARERYRRYREIRCATLPL